MRTVEVCTEIDLSDYVDEFWEDVDDETLIDEYDKRGLNKVEDFLSAELIEHLAGKMSLTDADNFREYISNIILKK